MFAFFSMLLLRPFFRLKELISKKWFNYIVTFFFFEKIAKKLGSSNEAKYGENKGDGLKLKRREMNSRIHTGWAAD